MSEKCLSVEEINKIIGNVFSDYSSSFSFLLAQSVQTP